MINTSTKIFILRKRELLYTVLLLLLILLLILCLVFMFSGKSAESSVRMMPQAVSDDNSTNSAGSDSHDAAVPDASLSSSKARYIAGVYTAPVSLGTSSGEIAVTVNASAISDIRLVNLSESAEASFPLVSSSLDDITAQILSSQSLDQITVPAENRYTAQLLLTAIADALSQARITPH